MARTWGLTLFLFLSLCAVSLAARITIPKILKSDAAKLTANHVVVPDSVHPEVSETPSISTKKGVKILANASPRATPCQTVAQWEGRASEWDHIIGINNRYNITYDGVNRRKRIMEDRKAKLPGRRIYEYIMLYDEGKQYTINHNYNTCVEEPLGTWRNHTIPPNATLEDMYEIGSPGHGTMVEEWSDRIPGRRIESWIGAFTVDGCWPISEIFMEKDETMTIVTSVSTRFFDLSEGIKNMSVFTPPPYCFNQTKPTPEPDTPPSPAEVPRPKPNRRRLPDQGQVILEKVRPAVDRLSSRLSSPRYDVLGRQHRLVAGQDRESGRFHRFKPMNVFNKFTRPGGIRI